MGLGANLGDRLASLRAATRSLASLGEIVRTSRVFETAPVGPPQPDYLNAAVLLATAHEPEDLLDALLRIERAMGRVRDVKWGPRVIDLDILWIDGVALTGERLAVPHAHLISRAFALLPLLDVAPEARDPRTGKRYAELPLDTAGVRVIDNLRLIEM